jgi:hypothetical protein
VTLALRLDEAFDAPLSDDDIVGAVDIAGLHDDDVEQPTQRSRRS